MAALLRGTLGVEADLVVGTPGELTILVGGVTVAKKGWFGFPSDRKVLAAVQTALGRG